MSWRRVTRHGSVDQYKRNFMMRLAARQAHPSPHQLLRPCRFLRIAAIS